MKKNLFYPVCALLVSTAFMFQACLKDTSTRTYTMYSPVYKSVEEVTTSIKSDAPQPVIKPGKIFLLGNYIFLNEIDKGVHIIDNTNPAAPVNKHFIAIPGNLDLAVKGNTLYADLYTSLVAINISNPAAVQVKKITEKVFPRRQYLGGFAEDTSRIIVDWIKKDTTVNYNNQPAIWWGSADFMLFNSAQLASSAASAPVGVGGSMARFALLNNYLYTVTYADLNIFNISEADNPIFSNKINVGWNIETIYPFRNNLFIGSQNAMYVYNTANPAQPSQTSTFSHVTSCDPVIADDNFAYVTLRSGTNCRTNVNRLDIVSIQNLQSPVLSKSYPLTNPHGLSKSGNTLFICDGTDGLKVFDAASPTNVKLLQHVKGLNAYDVIAKNKLAIVVGEDGLYQYDYSDVSNLILKSKISYTSK